MNTNRREVLKQLLIFTGGIILLPSCLKQEDEDVLVLKNINLSKDEQVVLAHLASILIPSGDTPGAIEVNAHHFALTTLDDCYEKEELVKFTKGLQKFNELVKYNTKSSFIKCSSLQKEELVMTLEKKENSAEEVQYFYSTFKNLCIRGYLNSKYYLTKVKPYQLIPVEFKGCKPVPNKEKI